MSARPRTTEPWPWSTWLIGLGMISVGLGTILKVFEERARQRSHESLPVAPQGLPGLPGANPPLASVPIDATPAEIEAARQGRLLPGQLADGTRTEPKIRTYDTESIERRLHDIARLIQKGGQDPEVRRTAELILTKRAKDGRWATRPKDWAAEARALYAGVTDPQISEAAIRYTRDMLRTDLFSAAKNTGRSRAGDCDDLTIYLGALLESVGAKVKLRAIQAKGKRSWSHIYILAETANDKWMPLDASMPEKGAGWEAEGAEVTVKTGRASGRVERVIDWPV